MSAPPRSSLSMPAPATLDDGSAEAQAQLPTDLVLAIYRLVRGCGLHADTNNAVISLVDATLGVLGEFGERLGVPHASILVAEDAVFVNGRQLRARRDAYASAMELGAMLAKCGVNEATLRVAASRQDLATFARAISDGLHAQQRTTDLHGATFGGVRLRKVRSNPFGSGTEDQAPSARTVRSYAAAVVVVRDFVRDLLRAPENLPNRLKRVAQRLVSQFEEDPRMLIALTGTAAAGADEAQLAVNTAVLAVATARQLTSDRVLLANLAMAALTYGVGRIRMSMIEDATGGSGAPLLRQLNEDEAASLPATTTAWLVGLGKIHPPNMVRTVVTHEALWLRHVQSRQPVYQGRWAPTVLARILNVARTFAELSVPTPGADAIPVDDVLQLLFDRTGDATERAYLKLLVGALGIFPVGTVVELDTGEVAVVLGPPARPGDFAQPPVRIINNRLGEVLPEPLDVDLAQPPAPDQPRRFIRHPVEADESQMKAMRAYVRSVAQPGGTSPARPSAAPYARPTAPPPAQPSAAPYARPTAPPPAQPSAAPYARPTAPPPAQPSAAPYARPTAPPPAQPSAAPRPRSDPTRAVSREEYSQRIAALPRPEAPPPSQASAAPPLRSDPTRAVSREEYSQRIAALPRPEAPSPPQAPAAPPLRSDPTRAVSREEYSQRIAALPRPEAPSPPQAPPQAQPRAVDQASPPPRPAVPRSDPTCAVSWGEYEERLRPKAAPSLADQAGLGPAEDLDAMLEAYLGNPKPAGDGPPTPSPAGPPEASPTGEDRGPGRTPPRR